MAAPLDARRGLVALESGRLHSFSPRRGQCALRQHPTLHDLVEAAAALAAHTCGMQRLDRDGVALAYEETGSGAPPFLLVHGWTHDHTYLAPQADHLSRKHRVVSVDLRGHGESDKPDQPYTIAGLADDLAWLICELGLNRPIVVGHSMGGAVTLHLAGHHGSLVSAAILLDPAVFIPRTIQESLAPMRGALRSPGFREAQRQFVNGFSFLPSDDVQLRQQIVEHMSSAPQHVMAGCWEAMLDYDAAPAATACRVPVLCIAAARPIADLAAFRAANPQVVFGQTVGSGHYHQLLVPDQVNSMIDGFVAICDLAREVVANSGR